MVIRPRTRHYATRPHPSIDRMIRVDHAGERGADRIYAGQMAVLGNTSSGPVVKVSPSAEMIIIASHKLET